MEDALHIAWRLAALTKGYGGPHLLESYEAEQRPTMIHREERCWEHFNVPAPFRDAFTTHGALMGALTTEGEAIRANVKAHLDAVGSEVLDYGIELDARYKSPAIFLTPADGPEPAWNKKSYTPSTYPGSRAPHIFLKDAKTSILDTLGLEWSLVTFTSSGEEFDSTTKQTKRFFATAAEAGIPVESVVLVDEDHARKIWGYDFVLVRADGHVAWRGQSVPESTEEIRQALRIVTGWETCENYVPGKSVSDVDFLRSEFPESGALLIGEK